MLILVAGAFVIAAIFILAMFASQPPGPVTFTVYSGSVTTPQPFPPLVDQNVGVTYTVTVHEVTVPYGGGPGLTPTSKTPKVAVEDAVVVFTLAIGDASFADGSTTKSVTTGTSGLANVTIVPVKDYGDDTLSFVMKITTGSLWWKKTHTIPDTTTVQFEVEKP